MIQEDELSVWMDDWRAGEPGLTDPEAILRRVKRRSLGLKLVTAGELLLVLAALTFLTRFALSHPTPMDIAAMAALGLLSVAALAYSLWTRRGLWSPAAETTAAFLDLARRRARQHQEALRAARWLLAGEILIFIPWIWHRLHTAAALLQGFGFLALVAGIASAVLVWLERRARRERAELEGMRR
jgi:hypothetical protein